MLIEKNMAAMVKHQVEGQETDHFFIDLLMFMGQKNYVPQPAPVWDLNIKKEQTLFSYNQ